MNLSRATNVMIMEIWQHLEKNATQIIISSKIVLQFELFDLKSARQCRCKPIQSILWNEHQWMPIVRS